jgi:hypothetical protein
VSALAVVPDLEVLDEVKSIGVVCCGCRVIFDVLRR